METFVPKEIEEYIEKNAPRENTLLRRIVEETYATMEMPHMIVGRVEGAFLRLLARLVDARRILEIGTFTGYSALVMAEALPEGGKLITCESDKENAKKAQGYFDESKHGDKIKLERGPALQIIPKLEGEFDLVFIDADKPNYPNYWEAVLPLVRHNGLVVADNVLWSGKVIAPSDEESRAVARFNSLVTEDPRVESVMLSIRDGITVARKTS